MRVGVCQIDTRVGDLTTNARRILEAVRAAAALGADLALFPELVLTGFPPRDLLFDDSFVAATLAALHTLAADLDGLPPALVGTPWPSGSRAPGHPGLYNALALLHRGRATLACAKRLLPAYDVFHDPRWFVPGPADQPPLDLAGHKLGLLICEDLWSEGYPIDPARDLVRAGADLLLCASASPYRAGIRERRLHHATRATRAAGARSESGAISENGVAGDVVARGDTVRESDAITARATVTDRATTGIRPSRGVPLVYVNAAGAQDELIFDGGSFVMSADAHLQDELPRFEEAVVVVEPFTAPSIAPLTLAGTASASFTPTALLADEELRRALVLGVRGFARKNGIRRAFLGLSGGIDSAVVLCLAAEALGADAVTALAMPSRHTDPRSTECATLLAKNLGTAFEIVPIDALQIASELALAPLLASAPPGDTTTENVQARLRMLVLMAYLNRHGGLLLNTSNKTELALGYGTLHGDLAGTLSVLGDVTKPHVYDLARAIERLRPGTIPSFILTRPPSAELRPDQVDPFDYPVVAPIVEALVTTGAPPSHTRSSEPPAPSHTRSSEPPALSSFSPDHPEIPRFRRMIHAAESKRWQSGIILKVSEKAFGTGRLVPVTQARRPA